MYEHAEGVSINDSTGKKRGARLSDRRNRKKTRMFFFNVTHRPDPSESARSALFAWSFLGRRTCQNSTPVLLNDFTPEEPSAPPRKLFTIGHKLRCVQ